MGEVAAIIGIAAEVIGTISGAEAQQQAGRAQAKALNAQAAVRELQADEELRKTKKQVEASKKKSQIVFGEQVSSYAKAGVNLSDSPLLVLASNKFEMEQEAVEIERQGVQNASFIRAGAQVLRQEAKATKNAADMAVGGTILSGIGSIAGRVGGN